MTNVTLNRARFEAEARQAGYAATNGYLAISAIIRDTFAMPPAKQLLYMTVLMAAVQRVIRGNGLPDDLHGTTPLPYAHVGYISRRALAAATGLPRETVRRIVRELLDDGYLSQGPRGGVAGKAGVLAQPHVQQGLAALLTEFGTVAQRLLQLGVLEVRD